MGFLWISCNFSTARFRRKLYICSFQLQNCFFYFLPLQLDMKNCERNCFQLFKRSINFFFRLPLAKKKLHRNELAKVKQKAPFFYAERKMLMKKNRQRKMKLISIIEWKSESKTPKKRRVFHKQNNYFFIIFHLAQGKKALKFNSFYLCDAAVSLEC